MSFVAPVADLVFMLQAIGKREEPGCSAIAHLPDAQTLRELLEAAGAFASDRLAPLNQQGDRQGARLENGVVRTPDGTPQLYADWIAGGWNAVTAPEEEGGSELPLLVGTALMEIWTAANMAFALGPVLTQAAAEVLLLHGSADQKRRYLPKLVSGEWAASMALTEPQAGSDLSQLRSRAEATADGSYRVRGQKIFITYGDHDLTPNVIHLVLARLPDAPAGTRGISLFLVPKFLPDEAGAFSRPNDLRCTGLEHKLGLHASPTCSMSYGDAEGARGWLVGRENEGLACMFTMMNRARLSTGLQGVAIAERAYQQAASFAADRRQGRDAAGTSVTIDRHPDVRRMLRTIHAMTIAGRALSLEAAAAIDRGDQARAALLTPVVKAFCSDLGVEAASIGVQVHGGMGYVEETGAAQHLRDSRIVPIYEGTNGIQAIDLVGRKLQRDGGHAARAEILRCRTIAEAARPATPGLSATLGEAAGALELATDWLLQSGRAEEERLAVATPYLRLFGTVVAGSLLIGLLDDSPAVDADRPADFAATVQFYADHFLRQASGLASAVTHGAASVLAA